MASATPKQSKSKGFNCYSVHSFSKSPLIVTIEFAKDNVIFSKLKAGVQQKKEHQISNLGEIEPLKNDQLRITFVTLAKPYKKLLQFDSKEDRDLFEKLANAAYLSNGRAYRLFSQLDNDNNGVLDPDELRSAMKAAGIQSDFKCKDSIPFTRFLLMSVQEEQRKLEKSLGLSHTAEATGQAGAGGEKKKGSADDDLANAIAQLLRGTPTREASGTLDIMNTAELKFLAGERVTVSDNQFASRVSGILPSRGSLLLTNYRLVFQDYRDRVDGSFDIPWGMLRRAEKADKILTLYSKDFRVFRILFSSHQNHFDHIHKSLKKLAFHGDQKQAFAYSHTLQVSREDNGWNFFDPLAEYERLRLKDDPNFRITFANMDYSVCPTYPKLFVVPRQMTDEEIAKVAAYRSKGRLPAVVYIHPRTKATLSRCAQPLAGFMSARNLEDEKMVQLMRETNPTMSKVIYLMDARPRKAAMGNAVMGKGYESTDHYKKSELRFLNIDNIHAIRGALEKLYELVSPDTTAYDDDSWMEKLEATKWLYYVRIILKASVRLVEILDQGASVMIHCSDGWDRTSQLCALVKLLLDPYYRTRRGFAVLVEQEWLSFGHQFAHRSGHLDEDFKNDQRAPIFSQWLDCVWQLHRQFPRSFEFSETFLLAVADHTYSCRFGTFLFDCERLRYENSVQKLTTSIWSYVCHPDTLEYFGNPYYRPCGILIPCIQAKRIVLWETNYLRVDRSSAVKENESIGRSKFWLKYNALLAKLAEKGVEVKEDEIVPSGMLAELYNADMLGQSLMPHGAKVKAEEKEDDLYDDDDDDPGAGAAAASGSAAAQPAPAASSSPQLQASPAGLYSPTQPNPAQSNPAQSIRPSVHPSGGGRREDGGGEGGARFEEDEQMRQMVEKEKLKRKERMARVVSLPDNSVAADDSSPPIPPNSVVVSPAVSSSLSSASSSSSSSLSVSSTAASTAVAHLPVSSPSNPSSSTSSSSSSPSPSPSPAHRNFPAPRVGTTPTTRPINNPNSAQQSQSTTPKPNSARIPVVSASSSATTLQATPSTSTLHVMTPTRPKIAPVRAQTVQPSQPAQSQPQTHAQVNVSIDSKRNNPPKSRPPAAPKRAAPRAPAAAAAPALPATPSALASTPSSAPSATQSHHTAQSPTQAQTRSVPSPSSSSSSQSQVRAQGQAQEAHTPPAAATVTATTVEVATRTARSPSSSQSPTVAAPRRFRPPRSSAATQAQAVKPQLTPSAASSSQPSSQDASLQDLVSALQNAPDGGGAELAAALSSALGGASGPKKS